MLPKWKLQWDNDVSINRMSHLNFILKMELK